MQSRDRAAPLRRARRGLAGDRRRHHPRNLTPPPPLTRTSTIASPSRVSDAAGHSVCKLHTRNAARWREGWLRPPPPPPPPPPTAAVLLLRRRGRYIYIYIYIRGFHPPPATVSDVHYDPRAAASARARRAAGRCLIAGTRPAALRVLVFVCVCVCARVCVCAGAGADGTRGCGGGVGGEAGRRRRRGRGWEGTA